MAKTLKRESCPYCLSKDNVCTWEHDVSGKMITRCRTPGCEFNSKEVRLIYDNDFLVGDVVSLEKSRGITKETAMFCDIQATKYNGRYVSLFNYKNKDGIVKQKVKFFTEKGQKKEMFFKGNGADLGLYLQDKWEPNPNLFIAITEGEEDAAAVCQSQKYQFPVVSIPKGASDAARSLEHNLKYLLGFKYVVLAFDNDDMGRKATEECLSLFEPERVRVAQWKEKDANDTLMKHGEEEVRKSILFAREFIPDSIVSAKEIVDRGINKTEYGPSFPWKSWNEASWGLQPGIQIIVGTHGVGKTTIVNDIIFNFIDNGVKVFYMNFEQPPSESIKRLIGAKLSLDLASPDTEWDQNKINEIAMSFDHKIWFYDKAGDVNPKDLFNAMRYEAKSNDVKLFVLDNLKAAGVALDNKAAESFMNKLESLMKELGTTIILLSHVAQDKYKISTHVGKQDEEDSAENTAKKMQKPGLDWSTGRMPTAPEGYNIIPAKASIIYALARNQFAEEETERNTTIVKVIKSRYHRKMIGKEFKLLQTGNKTVEIDEFNNPEVF